MATYLNYKEVNADKNSSYLHCCYHLAHSKYCHHLYLLQSGLLHLPQFSLCPNNIALVFPLDNLTAQYSSVTLLAPCHTNCCNLARHIYVVLCDLILFRTHFLYKNIKCMYLIARNTISSDSLACYVSEYFVNLFAVEGSTVITIVHCCPNFALSGITFLLSTELPEFI